MLPVLYLVSVVLSLRYEEEYCFKIPECMKKFTNVRMVIG